MSKISIRFTRFSAFYTPLIATMAAGFLKEEGLEHEWSVSAPGESAVEALLDGSAHVAQSAPSQNLSVLARGGAPRVRHFAQVNEMDGFFITGRDADPDFTWDKLEGSEVLVDHGGQPLAMFKYACMKAGVDFDKINATDAGGPAAMDEAFRAGAGQYIHQQGPAPQKLEFDGLGHVVAKVGELVGPNAFSSLAATPAWLETDMARAFTRAYVKTRRWINDTPAAEIAKIEKDFFPDIKMAVLTSCIETYQDLGNWTPHIEITEEALDAAQAVFEYNGRFTGRFPYDQVCAKPPEV